MRNIFLLVLFAALISCGCSSSNGVTSPTVKPNQSDMSNIPIIGVGGNPDIPEAIGLMGAYNLTINPGDLKAELISKRYGAIGESYIVSGTAFFTIAPCSNCLKVKSISLTTDGNLDLTFYIRHPFQPGDPSKPPTGKNRLDLDIFDLAMLVHPLGSTPVSYPLIGSSAYASVLANSSGYTRELSSAISEDAALPYVLVVDDSVSGTPGWNKFGMGSEMTFDAVFDLSGGDLTFELYLTMGYGSSAKKAERLNPKYYNPEFNRKAAWKVAVTPPEGTDPPEVGNTWQDNDLTTTYNVTVRVYDWQIGATVNPDLTDITDIYAASDVASVSVEIPGMNSTLPVKTTADSGTGTPTDPLVYIIPIANQNGLAAGEYIGLVKVTDQRIPGTSIVGGETDTLAHNSDGTTRWFSIPEFAAYQTFTATVVVGCGPVTGSITSPVCPVTGVASGASINFSASASSANGGDPVVLYEWDMNYDGVPANFSIDATGANVTLGPFVNSHCPSPAPPPESYTVAVRGTDSCVPPNHKVFATCLVTVTSCLPPAVGNVTLKVNRLDLASNYRIDETGAFTLSWTNPGGSIAEYAIYKDSDPLDGLTNSLVIAGTTTTTSFTDTISVYPTNRYITGWTYIVRARSVAGSPASEGPDSEPAFVTTNGWETQVAWQVAAEGWQCGQETSYSAYYNRPFTIAVEGQSQGALSVRSSPFLGGNWMTYAGRWDVMVKKPPAVPNSTVRFLDFQLWIYQMYTPQGMILGTCSYAPGLSWTTTTDFDWAQSASTSGYWGYSTDSGDVRSTFGDIPATGNNAWINSNNNDRRKLAGGDVNVGGDPTDQYIGMAWVKLDSTSTQQYPFVDEMAIAIY